MLRTLDADDPRAAECGSHGHVWPDGKPGPCQCQKVELLPVPQWTDLQIRLALKMLRQQAGR